MARILRHYIEAPRACSYLDDTLASLEIRLMLDISPEELERMLSRGWRRFGPCYFRPACDPCDECKSLRLPVKDFHLSQSQKRARKANQDLRVEIGPPEVDQERLRLYHRWHRFREDTRDWERSPLNADSYRMEFAFPHPAARELRYYDDHPPDGGSPRLIGVSLCDETPNAWSAIYFFYDPEYRQRSLGTFNVLYQVELARQRGRSHVYLGYRVEGCPSMRYKSSFRPHEVLVGRPSFHKSPRWKVRDPSAPGA